MGRKGGARTLEINKGNERNEGDAASTVQLPVGQGVRQKKPLPNRSSPGSGENEDAIPRHKTSDLCVSQPSVKCKFNDCSQGQVILTGSSLCPSVRFGGRGGYHLEGEPIKKDDSGQSQARVF